MHLVKPGLDHGPPGLAPTLSAYTRPAITTVLNSISCRQISRQTAPDNDIMVKAVTAA